MDTAEPHAKEEEQHQKNVEARNDGASNESHGCKRKKLADLDIKPRRERAGRGEASTVKCSEDVSGGTLAKETAHAKVKKLDQLGEGLPKGGGKEGCIKAVSPCLEKEGSEPETASPKLTEKGERGESSSDQRDSGSEQTAVQEEHEAGHVTEQTAEHTSEADGMTMAKTAPSHSRRGEQGAAEVAGGGGAAGQGQGQAWRRKKERGPKRREAVTRCGAGEAIADQDAPQVPEKQKAGRSRVPMAADLTHALLQALRLRLYNESGIKDGEFAWIGGRGGSGGGEESSNRSFASPSRNSAIQGGVTTAAAAAGSNTYGWELLLLVAGTRGIPLPCWGALNLEMLRVLPYLEIGPGTGGVEGAEEEAKTQIWEQTGKPSQGCCLRRARRRARSSGTRCSCSSTGSNGSGVCFSCCVLDRAMTQADLGCEVTI
eukprot:jgi/Mesen1/1341/ME000013S00834